jgi:hypothetical protein
LATILPISSPHLEPITNHNPYPPSGYPFFFDIMVISERFDNRPTECYNK